MLVFDELKVDDRVKVDARGSHSSLLKGMLVSDV